MAQLSLLAALVLGTLVPAFPASPSAAAPTLQPEACRLVCSFGECRFICDDLSEDGATT